MPVNKRPRQICRTTSMSQLGCSGGNSIGGGFTSIATAATAPESFAEVGNPPAVAKNAFCLGWAPPPCRQEDSPFHENMEVCDGASFNTLQTATAAAQNEEDPQSMVVDASVEESLNASHTDRTIKLDAYNLANQTPQSLHNRSMGSSFYRGEAVESVQPAHFLDVCFHCMKRLGHGRDIFIYRGDRAFCSVECRHYQIAADERGEKCGRTVKKVTTPAGSTGQQVETAAAA